MPASTARSTGAHSGPLKCAVLMPTTSPGYFFAMSAVGLASMSLSSCSNFPPRMPLPTMLRKARMRVLDRSMTRSLKSSKLRQPAHPASATVVTPTRNV